MPSPSNATKATKVKVLYAKPEAKPKVIVPSKALKNSDSPGFGFKGWKYTTANVQFNKDQQAQVRNICLDTRCIMILLDRDFLKEVVPDAVMKKMTSLVSIKSIGHRKHSSVNYTIMDLYFQGNNCCTATIHQEVNVVNSLKTKMLTGIDILGREHFTIDTRNQRAIIGSCNNVVISLEIAPQAHT